MSTRHRLDAEGSVICGASPLDDGSNVSSDPRLVSCGDCQRETVVCHTKTLPGGFRMYGVQEPDRVQTSTHEGPCRIGLGLVLDGIPNSPHNGAWFLRRTIIWAEGLEEFDDLVAVAQEVLTRPVVNHLVEVTPEERQAIRDLTTEASEYWANCDYASDEDEEDALLGRLSESESGAGIWMCLRGDWTTTIEEVTG